MKHPSPLAKPAIQLGSIVFLFKIEGLDTGLISGKDNFNSSDKPKLIEAFILRTFINPFLSRCCLFLINETASLKVYNPHISDSITDIYQNELLFYLNLLKI